MVGCEEQFWWTPSGPFSSIIITTIITTIMLS